MGGSLEHPSRHRRDQRRSANYRRNIGAHIEASACGDPCHEKNVTNARATLVLFGPDVAPTFLDCGCRFLAIWVRE